MIKFRIFMMALLGLIVVTFLGGCGIGGSIAATPNPSAVFPKAPSLKDFDTLSGYAAAVKVYPAKLEAAHDAAVDEAEAERDKAVAKAEANRDTAVAKAEANRDTAVAKAEANRDTAVAKANATRDKAVAKAKTAFSARKGELAAEMERRLADSKAERELVASFGSVDDLQVQIDRLQAQIDRVNKQEAAPLAAPATPCVAQPAFTG